MITFRTASHVTAITQEGTDWTLDGEMAPYCPQAEIQNLHHAIRLVK